MTDRLPLDSEPRASAAPAAAPVDPAEALRLTRYLLHDVLNHLHAVLSLADMALILASDPASVRMRVQMDAQTRELRRLLELLPPGLRGLAHLPRQEPFEAARFVPALLDLYRPLAAEHGMRLTFAIDDAAPSPLLDARALHRLVGNLVVNAIRHSGASVVAVFVEPLDPGDGLCIVVVDDGRGIAPSALASLQGVLAGQPDAAAGYERYGLAGCAALAAALGGRVMLRSRTGEGTTATIVLPRPTRH